MTESFEPSEDIRRLIHDARTAFVADTTLLVELARAAGSYVNHYHDLPEREEVPAPPPPYHCPDSHPHGSTLCLERHGCRCELCVGARPARAAQRRAEADERPEVGPVSVRRVPPTKTAKEGQQQGAYVRGSRPITTLDQSPKALPAGTLHGGSNAYTRYRCRCDSCRSWKAESNRATKANRAARAASQRWNPSIDDD